MTAALPTIGILGVGNLLLSDEGFGPHCIRHLEQHWRFPKQVLPQDGGTAGLFLSPFIEECDRLIVIDCVELAAPPGSLHAFTDAELRAGTIQTRLSPHQIGLLEIIDLCRMGGKAPRTIDFLAVIPVCLEPGLTLSPEVAAVLPEAAERVIALLHGYNAPPLSRS